MAKALVTALSVVLVALVLFAVIYFPVVYAQSSTPKPPTEAVAFRGFTREATGETNPWCIGTSYSIAYVNNGVEGPWSDFSQVVQSLSETFPLVAISAPPDPSWDVVVQRQRVDTETVHTIVPEWETRTGQAWLFVDRENPCQVPYTPPEPVPPIRVDWAQQVPPGRPWCVGTRYRAIYLGALGKFGPFSLWSDQLAQSLGNSEPVIQVLRPPPGQSSLQTYWVPSHVALPASPVFAFSVTTLQGTTEHVVPWPFPGAARSTPDFIMQFAHDTMLRFGAFVFFPNSWVYQPSESSRLAATLRANESEVNVASVSLSGRADDVLARIGFGAQTIVRGQTVQAPQTVPWLYSTANDNVFVPEFLVGPSFLVVDRDNLCLGVIPPKPSTPEPLRFTDDLASPT